MKPTPLLAIEFIDTAGCFWETALVEIHPGRALRRFQRMADLADSAALRRYAVEIRIAAESVVVQFSAGDPDVADHLASILASAAGWTPPGNTSSGRAHP